MSWEWVMPFARYTGSWRQARKLLDRGLRPGAIAAYHPTQQMKARVLLANLLTSPNEWESHLEQFVALTFTIVLLCFPEHLPNGPVCRES
jgi:cytochrome P450